MKKSVFTCAFLLLCVSSLFSAVIHVPEDYGTIQAAVDAAVSGDTINVAAGTYIENIVLKDGVELIGAGEDVTIINGNGTDRVIFCEDCTEGTKLEGFTIKNGDVYRGGGMYNLNSSIEIANCIFESNTAKYGGGMLNDSSSTTITNCTFNENTYYCGGGMLNRNSAEVTISNCTFTANTSENNGGAIRNTSSSTVTITDCIFTDNIATNTNAGGIFCEGGTSVTITGCTLARNFPQNITGDYTDGGGNNLDYRIDIDTNNSADYRSIQEAINASADGDILTVMPGTYVENLNMSGKAITLQSSAPEDPDTIAATIIDGGANGSVITCNSKEGSNTVISGFVITNGSGTVHMVDTLYCGGGIYINNSSPTITNCTFQDNTVSYDGGGIFNIFSSPTITNCTFTNNSANRGGGVNNASSTPTMESCTFKDNIASYYGGGVFNFNCTITMESCTFKDNVTDDSGGGMYNYQSSLTMGNCIFSGNSAYYGSGIYFLSTSSTTVNRCTFSNNTASYNGSGMYNKDSSPTVNNCTFIANRSDSGSGIYNFQSTPEVCNCVFTANRSDSGSGIYNSSSSPAVTSCIFTGNMADSGGGIYNSSSNPTVTNCNFFGNTASTNGNRIYNTDSSPAITNCIFLDTDSNSASEFYNSDSGSIPVISYCNISGCGENGSQWDNSWGTNGGGNIDCDPMYVRNPDDGGDGWGDDPETEDIDESANDDNGDLRLLPASPCIDAGNSTVLGLDMTASAYDYYGNPRIIDILTVENTGMPQELILYGTGIILPIDLGAYEFHSSEQITGDFSGDGKVDLADLAVFAENWLSGL